MDGPVDLSLIHTVAQIFVADLLLSGDNAVMVGLVSYSLPRRERRLAIAFGTILAVLLRIALTLVASFLLELPGLMLVGAIALLVVAVKSLDGARLRQLAHAADPNAARGSALGRAIVLIVAANLVMSFDNTVAVAAIARGNYLYLALGLALSVPFLMWGSTLAALLLRRYRPLVVAAAAMLGWIAGAMATSDALIAGWVHQQAPALPVAVPLLMAAYIVIEDRFRRSGRLAPEVVPAFASGPAVRLDFPAPAPETMPAPKAASAAAGESRLWGRRRPSGAPPSSAPRFVPPTIESAEAAGALALIVAANPMERGTIADALSALGCAREVAADGPGALKMLARRRYGLILLDCYMSAMSGFEVAQHVREAEAADGTHAAIIGLLGYLSDPGGPQKCIEAGMDDAVGKAAVGVEIERIVTRWLPPALALRRLAAAGIDAIGEVGQEIGREVGGGHESESAG